MAAHKDSVPSVSMGPKIQALYDALTPLALLIKDIQESSGVGEATAYLAVGFSAMLKDADDLALTGLVLDMLWKLDERKGE